MLVQIKRVYEKPDKDDGVRILVDRLWPRGLSKNKAKIDYWMKEIAPSDALRKWFGHKEERWEELKRRYREELKTKKDLIEEFKNFSRNSNVTLLYAAKDKQRNNAVVLLELFRGK